MGGVTPADCWIWGEWGKISNERAPSLVGSLDFSCRYKRFLFWLGCSSLPRARICRSFKETRYRFSAWRAGTKPYLSYWPARLHGLAKSIPRYRFLGSINVYKYGLCTIHFFSSLYSTPCIFNSFVPVARQAPVLGRLSLTMCLWLNVLILSQYAIIRSAALLIMINTMQILPTALWNLTRRVTAWPATPSSTIRRSWKEPDTTTRWPNFYIYILSVYILNVLLKKLFFTEAWRR